jgi:hypothetical protein
MDHSAEYLVTYRGREWRLAFFAEALCKMVFLSGDFGFLDFTGAEGGALFLAAALVKAMGVACGAGVADCVGAATCFGVGVWVWRGDFAFEMCFSL